MDLNQITYFLNLADTLNFTQAADRSGVAQPSLTRAIRKLEDELGAPLVYRDGKGTRLTALGRDIQAEFLRFDKSMCNVRELAENTVHGRKRLFNLAVVSTISPNVISGFLTHVLAELPSVEIHLHALAPGEGVEEILTGKYDGCFLPNRPKANF